MDRADRMTQSQRKQGRGFTLIEMMVTILILVILTMAALPSFQSFIAGQRIKNTAFDIMAMLTLTRSEAIKRNAQVTSTPGGNDWTQGWSITAAGGTLINKQDPLPTSNIIVTCLQGTALLPVTPCNAITYNASGRIANGQQQAIQITSTTTTSGDGTGGGMRCITIDLSGRPNSKKGTC